jgi:hypothetical protein
MIDKKFTEDIQAIVQSDNVTDEQVVEGVQLLRRIAPRNMMYMRWAQLANSRPAYIKGHVLKELKKHLTYRLDELTRDQVRILDIKVQKEVIQTLQAHHTGKREDHDLLPDEIKALWDDNASIYKKMKDKFEECRALSDKMACDRYEVLKVLAELDDTYRKNMKAYDEYVIEPVSDGAAPQDQGDAGTTELSEDAAKAVGAARTYISRNIEKLEGLVAAAAIPDADADIIKKRDDVLSKIQERVTVLIENKAVISDAITQRLNAIGITTDAED